MTTDARRLGLIVTGRTRVHVTFSEIAVSTGSPVGEGMICREYSTALMTGHARNGEIVASSAILGLAIEREGMGIDEALTMRDALQVIAAMAHIATLFLHVTLSTGR
jgi:hypothetical protein